VDDLDKLAKKTTDELRSKQQELERSEAGRRAQEDEMYVKVPLAAHPSLPPITAQQALHAKRCTPIAEGRAMWTMDFAVLEDCDVCLGCKHNMVLLRDGGQLSGGLHQTCSQNRLAMWDNVDLAKIFSRSVFTVVCIQLLVAVGEGW
jgi:hypothetical protein